MVLLAAPSELQLASRQRMSVVNAFLKPIMPFINVGYAELAAADRVFPQNVAVSYLFNNALQGVYPSLAIDYAKVLVSRGSLAAAASAAVALEEAGLSFSWAYDPTVPLSLPSDELMVMAYFPGLGKAVFEIGGAVRSSGSGFLALPEALKGDMEVYMGFAAVDRTAMSDSVYLGRVNR